MKKIATAIRLTAIEAYPTRSNVLLLYLYTTIGDATATIKLQHPTMYEPTLAENEIEPLAFISPKIVLE